MYDEEVGIDYAIERVGIVDEVSAKRRKEEVVSLRAKVRFQTDLEDQNSWSTDKTVDEMYISFEPGAPVNPGDLVHLSVRVTSPFGKRFRPALETGTHDVVSDELREAVAETDGYFCEVSECSEYADWKYPNRLASGSAPRYLCDIHDQAQWQTDENGELITDE